MKKSLLILTAFLLCISLSSCDKILGMAKSAVTGEEVSKPPEDFIATIEGEEFTYDLYKEYVKITAYVGEDADVEIPSEIDDRPVRVIGALCFNKTPVVNVVISESVKLIETSAFYYANALKKIVIPDTVETIETRAFGWCDSLEEVVIGKGISEIPDYCFNHCISLTSITIPENITRIGIRAFSYCEKFDNVTIPKSVTAVGDLAFAVCPSLKSVVIQNNDAVLGKDLFSESAQAVVISEMNSKPYEYCVENNLFWANDINSEPTRLGDSIDDNADVSVSD